MRAGEAWTRGFPGSGGQFNQCPDQCPVETGADGMGKDHGSAWLEETVEEQAEIRLVTPLGVLPAE